MGLASRIWLPRSARPDADETPWECSVPVGNGVICGLQFPRDQRDQFHRHVIACSTKHDDVAQAERAAIEDEPLNQYDKEAFAFGRRREAEGKRGFKGGGPT